MPRVVATLLLCSCLQLSIIQVASRCVLEKDNVTVCAGSVTSFRNAYLKMLVISECSFDVISSVPLNDIAQLTQLKISCNRRMAFRDGWTRPLAKSNLKVIDLSDNFIFELPSDTFCELKALEEVRLETNEIKYPETLGFGRNDSDGCEISSRIKNLFLSRNDIRVLANDTFIRLTQLENLVLSDNVVELIEPFAFRGLSSLGFLNISGNKLSKLSSNVLLTIVQLSTLNANFNSFDDQIFEAVAPLVNMRNLYLGNNQIENLNATVLQKLINLYSLMLNNNRIKNIPSSCFINTRGLALLDLHSNNLTGINSDDFSGLNNLITLHLSNNRIHTIADDVFDNFTELRNLFVDGNQLNRIPNIRNLHRLFIFNISNNRIQHLSDEDFINNAQLYQLVLSHNKLKFLSQKLLRNLGQLSSLDLSRNLIERIEPDALNVSKDLKDVRLDENRLTSIKNIFRVNSRVKKLNLSSNLLPSFSWTDFPFSLEEIQLDNNLIERVESSGNPPQLYLKTIDLHNNRLSRLNPGEIPHFVNLRLDNNSIRSIENLALANHKNWQYINLRNNKLRQLCKFIIPAFSSVVYDLPELLLSGNPFECNCELEWVVNVDRNPQPIISDLDRVSCKGEDPYLDVNVTSGVTDNLKNGRFWCKSGLGSANANDMSCSCYENWMNANSDNHCFLNCPRNCTCYRNANWSDVVMQCYNNGLVEVPKNGSKKTVKIFIKGNYIPVIKKNDFMNYINLTHLLFSDNRLRFIEDKSFLNLSNLNELALAYNHLQKLSNNTFIGLVNLFYLYLNNNQLREIEIDAFSSLENLKEIQLHNNFLSKFPVWNLMVPQVTVGSNPWSCECEFVNKFRQWLTNSIILDTDNATCLLTSDNSVVYMVTINDTVCLENNEHITYSTMTVIISSFLILFLSSIIIIFILFYFRKEIQVLIYAKYGFRFGRQGIVSADKPYDAFLSYSSLDDQFLVDNILPGLETEVAVPYRLCLHQRDFAAGAFITDAILEAVERSKATLLLLSQNFLDSEWCRFEFKAAHLQMLRDPQSKVIVVLLQPTLPKNLDPEIKLYLKTNTYIVWGDKLFWKRLYFALPKPTGDHAQIQADLYM